VANRLTAALEDPALISHLDGNHVMLQAGAGPIMLIPSGILSWVSSSAASLARRRLSSCLLKAGT